MAQWVKSREKNDSQVRIPHGGSILLLFCFVSRWDGLRFVSSRDVTQQHWSFSAHVNFWEKTKSPNSWRIRPRFKWYKIRVQFSSMRRASVLEPIGSGFDPRASCQCFDLFFGKSIRNGFLIAGNQSLPWEVLFRRFCCQFLALEWLPRVVGGADVWEAGLGAGLSRSRPFHHHIPSLERWKNTFHLYWGAVSWG